MADPAGTPNPVDRVVGALEAHGQRVRRQQRGWSATCPAHPDNSPSLSINESETGNALICCHAGCTTAEVCRELGLSLADLFPPKPPKLAHIGPSGRFKAAYTYHDEDGEALFRVVRYEPKTFRQQHPDGKGGWASGVDGVRQVPYHLPQIRKAITDGRAIWVCEGEKDAENAEWFVHDRIVATCNAMGAGKWRDEHAQHLYGATKVVVVADNDRTGHEHARQVAKSLVDHVDRVIVVLPAVGKDLTDHFQAQKGLDDFVTAWDTLSPSDWLHGEAGPDEENDSLPVPIDWATFWDRDSTQEWLVEPLIPLGRHVVLYAPAKEGKSLLALEVAAAAATGRPVLGTHGSEPVRVVYLDFEMTEDDLLERLEDMGYDRDSDLSNLFYYSLPDLPPLDTAAGGQAVEAIVRRHEAQMIVIDTMARVVQGEENSNDTYRWFDMHVSLRMKMLRVAVLRLDHAGKDITKGQRGASEKVGYADVIWQLRYDKQTGSVTLKATHKRVGWVRDQISMSRVEEPWLSHLVDAASIGVPSGTKEIVALLEEFGVPVEMPVRAAAKVLRDAGRGHRTRLVSAAQKARREDGKRSGNAIGEDTLGNMEGNMGNKAADLRETLRETRETLFAAPAGKRVSPYGGHAVSGVPDLAEDDSYEGLI
jgi:KaiC/GvpD/RAD55 family RecA-like ATPase